MWNEPVCRFSPNLFRFFLSSIFFPLSSFAPSEKEREMSMYAGLLERKKAFNRKTKVVRAWNLDSLLRLDPLFLISLGLWYSTTRPPLLRRVRGPSSSGRRNASWCALRCDEPSLDLSFGPSPVKKNKICSLQKEVVLYMKKVVECKQGCLQLNCWDFLAWGKERVTGVVVSTSNVLQWKGK